MTAIADAGDLRGLVLDLQVDLETPRGDPHVPDLADLDAAIAHRRVREDAARTRPAPP